MSVNLVAILPPDESADGGRFDQLTERFAVWNDLAVPEWDGKSVRLCGMSRTEVTAGDRETARLISALRLHQVKHAARNTKRQPPPPAPHRTVSHQPVYKVPSTLDTTPEVTRKSGVSSSKGR